MKVFSVIGISKSGKTTTIENIIRELRRRDYSVGSVKEIHYEMFAIDDEGTNTDRHKKAGSQLVAARGYNETDILFQNMLPVEEILRFYSHDYVVLEGVTDANVPKIITAYDTNGIDERLDDSVFAISGRVSSQIKEYKGIPVINAVDNTREIVDLIEDKVYEKLPNFKPECCSACGYNCRELGIRILKGESKRDECSISKSKIKLSIDGKQADMVPFVQNILYNAVIGVVSELDGYRPGAVIEIKTGDVL